MSIRIKNSTVVNISEIPVMEYSEFYNHAFELLSQANMHCLTYHAVPFGKELIFFCAIADDVRHDYCLFSHRQILKEDIQLESISAKVFSMHIFEREIAENFGVEFLNHPWPKPVRWSFDRSDKNKTQSNYPFFKIEGTKAHEVGVGPVHAGIIEPGHFRFSCYGEEVKHLEIHLGYQHRGVESLFLQKKHLLQRTVLSESIAGDMVAGHTLTFVQLMESLYDINVSKRIQYLRALALELERMAVHVGALSGFCTDVAYQLGSSVFGALRTPLINYFQLWCGNRFAKGLLRVGYNPHPYTPDLIEKLSQILSEFKTRYEEMADKTFALASVTNRIEKTGHITKEESESIGLVGIIARSAGVKRDLRVSHPLGAYAELTMPTHVLKTGDVYGRGKIRDLEIRMSLEYIENLLQKINALPEDGSSPAENYNKKLLGINKWCLSMTEAWRGETVHVAITNSQGDLHHYKVIDPSMHNWMGLALAVRNNEISDFPICNKSFDLSYCGHDL